MPTASHFAHIVLVGIGATALMDLWLLLLSRLGVPTTSFAMVGRWVGHFARGRFAHAAVSQADPIGFELGLGWFTHYAIGIAYTALLVALQGTAWLGRPTFLPALVFGAVTVAAPWFVMQPAMGAGFMALKTPTPLKNGLRNLANHSVFGAGMYVAAAALAGLVFSMQHGMLWVGNPILPEQHNGVPEAEAANRLGSWSGLMAQAGHAAPADSFVPGDVKTARLFGRHFAHSLSRVMVPA